MSNFAKYENLQALFTAIGKKKLSVSDTMPTAGVAYEDICILYIGPTDANYTKGYVYECEEVTPATDPKTYSWNAKINVDVDLSKYKTIFPGTKEEWEALTEAQQDQYDYCFFDGDESDYYAVSDEVTKGNMHPVTSNAVADILETKADEVSNATNGNFAGLDENGNLTDSGKKPSDFQTVLTFDNAPTENSNNPVKSNGVYVENQNIYEVMGQMSAKNLFYFDIDKVKAANTTGVWNGLTYTINGVAFTINDDGTVTANGTASSSAYLYLSLRGTKMFALPVGEYIETGSPSAGCQIEMTYTDSNNARQLIGTETGEGQAFEVTSAMISSYFDIGFNLYVIKDETVSNVVFYPMIRLASDTDSIYQPYAKTNKQLTEDKAEQAEVNDIVNVYGSKNLNKYPYYSTSLTTKGLTFTDLGDGRIKINGTATGTVNYVLQEQAEDSLSLEADADYLGSIEVISGSGSKGSGSQYQFRYERYHGHTSGEYKDIKFTSSYEEVSINTSNGNTNIGAYFSAYSGNTFTDLIIAPMIRKASIKDTTWVPYSKTNVELTKETTGLLDNLEVNGAVNILSIDLNYIKANNSASSWSGNACTHNGVTYTIDEANGKITVNGTASARSTLQVYDAIAGDLFKKSFKYLAKVFNNNFNTVNGYYVQLYMTNSPYTRIDAFTGNNFVVPDSFFNNSIRVSIQIVVENGKSVDNQVITPLIAFGNYTGGFEKYAKSNRELTEAVDGMMMKVGRYTKTVKGTNTTYGALIDQICADMKTMIDGFADTNTKVIPMSITIDGLVTVFVRPDQYKKGDNFNIVAYCTSCDGTTFNTFYLRGLSGSGNSTIYRQDVTASSQAINDFTSTSFTGDKNISLIYDRYQII